MESTERETVVWPCELWCCLADYRKVAGNKHLLVSRREMRFMSGEVELQSFEVGQCRVRKEHSAAGVGLSTGHAAALAKRSRYPLASWPPGPRLTKRLIIRWRGTG